MSKASEKELSAFILETDKCVWDCEANEELIWFCTGEVKEKSTAMTLNIKLKGHSTYVFQQLEQIDRNLL